jgi:hypothetical protein
MVTSKRGRNRRPVMEQDMSENKLDIDIVSDVV